MHLISLSAYLTLWCCSLYVTVTAVNSDVLKVQVFDPIWKKAMTLTDRWSQPGLRLLFHIYCIWKAEACFCSPSSSTLLHIYYSPKWPAAFRMIVYMKYKTVSFPVARDDSCPETWPNQGSSCITHDFLLLSPNTSLKLENRLKNIFFMKKLPVAARWKCHTWISGSLFLYCVS